MTERPVFWPELGKFFTNLRLERGWGQRQAAQLAANRGITALSRQQLIRLEKGQTKDPSTDVLRALANLYSLPYEEIVRRMTQAKYGVDVTPDQLRSVLDQQFGRAARLVVNDDDEENLLRAWRESDAEGRAAAATVLRAHRTTKGGQSQGRKPRRRAGGVG